MRCRDRSSPSGGQPHEPTSGDYQRPTSDQSGGVDRVGMPSRNPNQRRSRRSPQGAKPGRGRKARSLAVALRREVWRSPPGARASASPPDARQTRHYPDAGGRVTTLRGQARRTALGWRSPCERRFRGRRTQRREELFGQLEPRASALTGWLRAASAECHPTPRAASSRERPPDLTGSGGGADRDQLELGVQVGAHSVFGTDLVDDGALLLVVGHCHRDAAGVVDVRVDRR
jgi:hypothetical protein